jgi:hypothetical protein
LSRFARLVIAVAVIGLVASISRPIVGTIAAADGPQMDARALLQGHARVGSWLAIEVRLRNNGPSVVGELRLQGGSQGGTRFSMPVDLPNTSDKTFVLHAQPPSFGQQVEVLLQVGDQTVARKKVAFTLHDPNQLTIGVVAQNPAIIGGLQLPAGPTNVAPVVIPLAPSDLPERIEAWSALDRLIWQDVDSNVLSKEQLAGLRGWIAMGGRLIIAGGTSGPSVLSGFPDDILPYRPTTTLDVAPASLTSLLGALPATASDVPALAGSLGRGRTLATSGDRVVAADAPYGNGSVTIVGIDPSVGWIAASRASTTLWRNLIPPRSGGSLGTNDDSQIVSAVSEVPSLALPPTGGLLLLLLGYIGLIGPINYFVLRRLDRREWAWVTMPALIAIFAIGAYSFGSALRGSDVIVNQVAIVRGAPDATEGAAQVYVGVFSPTRGTYQVSIPSGALLSAPVVGDFFGGQGALLDVVQGATAKIRDLSVGFGSLRTVRAESAVQVPRIHADLRLVDGVLQGTIRNDSKQLLESPAIVLGSNTRILEDLPPGATANVSLQIVANQFGQSLSDRIFGQAFFNDGSAITDKQRRNSTRHRVIDQLTFDPMFGNLGSLPSDGPVILAWGRDSVLDVVVEGQTPSRSANVLYYVPVPMGVKGRTVFRADLIRSTVIAADAQFFSKDPSSLNFGQGSVTIAYRPLAFEGTFAVTKVLLALGFGGDPTIGVGGKPIAPVPAPMPPGCTTPCPSPAPSPEPSASPIFGGQWDGIPEVEVFDRTGDGAWVRLPHFAQGTTYELEHPERFVDPGSGTIQVRFVNDRPDGVGVSFNVSLEGTVR